MRKIVVSLVLLMASVSAWGYDLTNPAKVDVPTSGTRVQLTTNPKYAFCKSVVVTADENNTGTLYVGGSAVTSDRYTDALSAGDSLTFSVNEGWFDARTVWLDVSVNGDDAQWSVIAAP